MLFAVLATSIALQSTSPPQGPGAAAHASALRDSLEAAELRFFRAWGEAWRSSEGTRHGVEYSETELRARNLQLHCHPEPQLQVSLGATMNFPTAPGDPRPASTIGPKSKVPTMVKDPASIYALCPTWTYPDGVTFDERDGIDLSLTAHYATQMRDERLALIDQFDSVGARYPLDEWIVGQRVRLRVDQRQLDTALIVARQCGSIRWWCAALTAYVTALRGDGMQAESIFVAAIAAMPAVTRCEWGNLTELIELQDRVAYAKLSCAQRDSANVKLWWLADPLYIEPGNDRRVEHWVRKVGATLRAAAGRDERFDWRDSVGLNPLDRVVSRYGWPSYLWWAGFKNEWGHSDYLASGGAPLNQTYTTFEYSRDRMHAFPAWRAVLDPMHARAVDWDISAPDSIGEGGWWPREHFAPHNPILRLPDGQVAFLRRQNTALFAFATDVDQTRFGDMVTRQTSAILVTTDRPGSLNEVAKATPRKNAPLFVRAELPPQPMLVSVEFPGVDATHLPGGRTRFAIAPPPPLSVMKPGQYAISDPVVLLPPPSSEILPNGVDAVLPRMAGSTRVDKRTPRMGVYWETYGLKPGDSITVAVWIERYTPQGIMRNLGIALSIAQDLNTPVVYSWTEPQPDRVAAFMAGPVPILGRSLVLDVSQLAPGDYWLEVAVGKRGMQAVRGRRSFIVP